MFHTPKDKLTVKIIMMMGVISIVITLGILSLGFLIKLMEYGIGFLFFLAVFIVMIILVGFIYVLRRREDGRI